MRLLKVLHNHVLDSVPGLHATRATALVTAVQSLLDGAFLTVTALGRGLPGPVASKHNIKRMDRLLSNAHLHAERDRVYRALCHHLCRSLPRPLILVDWSDIVEQQRLMLLRAALVVNGRAVPLFERIYPLRQYNSPQTHRRFLCEFKQLLPTHCRPILITDAGFRGPWFAAVEKLGWQWIGRIRNGVNYRLAEHHPWRQTASLYAKATHKPSYLGQASLSSKHPYACHLYLYKKRLQHRYAKRSTHHLAKHSNSAVFAKQQRDPWLLATNLNPEHFSPAQIVALYAKRMQIEAAFRDLKSDQFGFGMTLSRSHRVERLNILLLIAALATLCLWWIGLHAREHGWHRQFQANTTVHRTVLSPLFLALQVIKHYGPRLTATELIHADTRLLQHISDSQSV
jgi:hypothetical protein